MTISYKWLCDYLPENIDPEKLSKILTSIGLEVESLKRYENVKGGLKGLIVAEVLTVESHPDADKLKLATVNYGDKDPIRVVCGAGNLAVGQKVIFAPVGATIYPLESDPITIGKAKIRGVESMGMLCAEDEIGLGKDHSGIIVLPQKAVAGTAASDYFKGYEDWIFEIGLTPNRMDSMSHLGVARDVCAYLTQHNKKDTKVKSPFANTFKADDHKFPIKINIENTTACQRFAGVSISGVEIKESPQWIKDRLIAIGLRPVNNIVDITNYLLHETGQPLHAYDMEDIKDATVIVKNLPADTLFTTLDEKERKLNEEDLMVCTTDAPMCMAGVFGGLNSGVKSTTKNIFLESAWFNPETIRKTSMRHNLRTDAALHFEKGVDISNTINVLKRAALLIKEYAGGHISSDIIDVYPHPKEKTQVALKHHYLKKLSGKNYHPDAVHRILVSLGFEIMKEGMDELWIAVPFSKPDITIPADIVEEILRIDGLDNIEIPESITITPAMETLGLKERLQNKLSNYLIGQGFYEILTNSITDSKYYTEDVLTHTVKMINNLSADLNIMRPSLLETGLEVIAYNLNRKNNNLRLFEFGKTYQTRSIGHYTEEEHLCLYLTGSTQDVSWKEKGAAFNFFNTKGLANAVINLCGIKNPVFKTVPDTELMLEIFSGRQSLGFIYEVDLKKLNQFNIKQPVFVADFNFQHLLHFTEKQNILFQEVPRFPAVERDLAILINKSIPYEAVEAAVQKENLRKLINIRLFDIFESEKLGPDKKSMAISFTFSDEQKTLTDQEVETMMNSLVKRLQNDLAAEIRS